MFGICSFRGKALVFFAISPLIIVAIVASVVGAIHCNRLTFERIPSLYIIDYLSLGIFAAVGATKAIERAGGLYADNINVIAFTFAGATAVGGGLLRDWFLLRRPAIAFATTYGLIAALGGIVHISVLRGLEICGWSKCASFGWLWTMTIVAVFAELTCHMRFGYQSETAKQKLTRPSSASALSHSGERA